MLTFTRCEQELLQWICLGKTIQESAQLMNKSPHTVNNQLRRVYEKLNVSSRIQLIYSLANHMHAIEVHLPVQVELLEKAHYPTLKQPTDRKLQ